MAIWRQSGMVWFGALAAAGLTLVTQVILARHFDAETFGFLSNGYALAILVATFAFHGVGETLLRTSLPASIPVTIATAALLLAVGLGLATTWVLCTEDAGSQLVLMLAFVPFIMVQSGVTAGMIAMQLRDSNRGITIWPGGFQLARLVVAVAVVTCSASVIWVPLGWFLVLVPMAAFGLLRLHRAVDWSRIGPKSPAGGTLRAALPLSASRVLDFAEIQLPVVLALPLLGPIETGRVAVCMAIVQGFLLLPISVFQRLLRARFHAWAHADPRRLRHTGLMGAGVVSLIGLAVGGGLRPIAEPLLVTIFGPSYADASDLLAALLLLLPIWFASIAVNATLVSPRLADLRLVFQAMGILILIGCSLLLGRDDPRPTTALIPALYLSQTFLLVTGGLLLWRIHSHSTPD